MQTDITEKIAGKVKVLSAEQKEKVLEFVENLEPQKRTPWQIWQEHLKDIPEEELDKIPTDASQNLDHYLYGAPKKWTVFFATLYIYTALVNPKDQWHQAAIEIEPLVETVDLVTTEEVLIELLNFYSEFGKRMRYEVSTFVRQLLLNPKFEIVGRGEMSFLNALELYESRLDKGYSLTDCISMNVCRELGITKILTHDRHFEQEGLTILSKTSLRLHP